MYMDSKHRNGMLDFKVLNSKSSVTITLRENDGKHTTYQRYTI